MAIGPTKATMQTAAAAAHLLACIDHGETLALAHEGAAGVTLKCLSRDPHKEEATRWGQSWDERLLRVFEVPLQTGFTGAVVANDEITHGGSVYQVQRVDPDATEAVYIVAAVKARPQLRQA